MGVSSDEVRKVIENIFDSTDIRIRETSCEPDENGWKLEYSFRFNGADFIIRSYLQSSGYFSVALWGDTYDDFIKIITIGYLKDAHALIAFGRMELKKLIINRLPDYVIDIASRPPVEACGNCNTKYPRLKIFLVNADSSGGMLCGSCALNQLKSGVFAGINGSDYQIEKAELSSDARAISLECFCYEKWKSKTLTLQTRQTVFILEEEECSECDSAIGPQRAKGFEIAEMDQGSQELRNYCATCAVKKIHGKYIEFWDEEYKVVSAIYDAERKKIQVATDNRNPRKKNIEIKCGSDVYILEEDMCAACGKSIGLNALTGFPLPESSGDDNQCGECASKAYLSGMIIKHGGENDGVYGPPLEVVNVTFDSAAQKIVLEVLRVRTREASILRIGPNDHVKLEATVKGKAA